jgi:hypothetical protein
MDLVNNGVYALAALKNNMVLVPAPLDDCLVSLGALTDVRDFGHRLTVVFGWSPNPQGGHTFYTFIDRLISFLRVGRGLEGDAKRSHREQLLSCYRNSLDIAARLARSKLLDNPDGNPFGPLFPTKDIPPLALLDAQEKDRELLSKVQATRMPSSKKMRLNPLSDMASSSSGVAASLTSAPTAADLTARGALAASSSRCSTTIEF